jgi:hypothetical protein
MESNKPLFAGLVTLLVDLHHLGASRCKCVPIVPIKLRGFMPFLYRIMPKIGSLVAKINKHLQRDVVR